MNLITFSMISALFISMTAAVSFYGGSPLLGGGYGSVFGGGYNLGFGGGSQGGMLGGGFMSAIISLVVLSFVFQLFGDMSDKKGRSRH